MELITLKNHVGIAVFCVLFMYMVYLFSDSKREEYEWYVPFVSGVLIFGIIEMFLWSFWFFFLA